MCSPPNAKHNPSYSKSQHSKNLSYILDFYVSSDGHFSRFEELKITFLTSFQLALGVMY